MSELNEQAFSCLLDGFLLWASGAVFFHPLPRREDTREREVMLLLPAVVLSFAVRVLGGQHAAYAVSGLVFLFLCGLFCCEGGKGLILYCSIWAMELSIVVYELCQFAVSAGIPAPAALVLRALIIVSSCLAAGATVSLWLPVYEQREAGPRQTLSALMLFVIFVALTYGFFHDGRFQLRGMLDLLLFMSQLYCLIVLYLQAALFQTSAVTRERDMIELLWQKEKAQYEQSRESIALINQKTHDLKHMLSAIRTMEGSEQREAYLQELQQSVEIYDSMMKTGNETLDTVLTEKSLLCKARSITVTCVADGARLSFMDPVDIYTLMGNAMDNAIEAVQQLQQHELRTIDVVLYQRGNLLLLSVTNPVEEELVFEDGLPRSTKPQDGYHGFGVRSMRSTVRKYGGELSVDTRDGCFSLNIVFPLNKQHSSEQ